MEKIEHHRVSLVETSRIIYVLILTCQGKNLTSRKGHASSRGDPSNAYQSMGLGKGSTLGLSAVLDLFFYQMLEAKNGFDLI